MERATTAGPMPGAPAEHGVGVLRGNHGIEPNIALFGEPVGTARRNQFWGIIYENPNQEPKPLDLQ